MYFRHLSIKYRSILSADMATDNRSIYPLICQPRLDRVSVDMLFKVIERWSTLSVGMSADTRPICWDRQSLVYQSTVGGVSVNYRRYRNSVNCCFAEILAVSLPTEDTKKELIAYVRVLIEHGCISNCRHFLKTYRILVRLCSLPTTWMGFLFLDPVILHNSSWHRQYRYFPLWQSAFYQSTKHRKSV